MEVRQIMSTNVECVAPGTTLNEAAARMKTRDIGFLPVCDNNRIVGTLTDRDVMLRAIAEDMDARKTKVKDIMTKEVFYCFDDQDVKEVAQNMSQQQVRRMIILNRDKKLVGVVSIGDVAKTDGEQKVSAETLRQISQAA